MTTNMIAGTAYLAVDGKNYQLVGELGYRVSQTTNETLTGMDGVHGVKGSPAAGMIKGKFRDSGAVDTQAIGGATDASVVVNLINGKTIIGRNMWRAGEPIEVDPEDGTFSVQWEGPDVREG